MLKILAGIVMLGILVFIHELGHFLIAKLFRVKVLKFSLGFGPRLFSRTWGETEYQVCLVPLGGYVQMLGEGDGEEAVPRTAQERHRSFADKPVSQRLAIVAAGPAMNLLLPLLILPVAFLIGVNFPVFLDEAPCIGYVLEQSVAGDAGLARGDCIVAVGDQPVVSWIEADKQLLARAGLATDLTVMRTGQSVHLSLPEDYSGAQGLQGLGLYPRQAAVVGTVHPGTPGERAGLTVGDRILSINGRSVVSWYNIRPLVQAGGGKALTLEVERDGGKITVELVPRRAERTEDGYLIGISPEVRTRFKRYGPGAAIVEGVGRTGELMHMTLLFLHKLFSGHISAKNIGGPIMVVQIAGAVASQVDLAEILSMLAFLSIQLGILNLLPVPILDGGHLLFGLVELVRRRPLSLQVREVAQQIGLVLIILLMGWAFYNDIMRLLFGEW
jgi:regulator of sigma E protease